MVALLAFLSGMAGAAAYAAGRRLYLRLTAHRRVVTAIEDMIALGIATRNRAITAEEMAALRSVSSQPRTPDPESTRP